MQVHALSANEKTKYQLWVAGFGAETLWCGLSFVRQASGYALVDLFERGEDVLCVALRSQCHKTVKDGNIHVSLGVHDPSNGRWGEKWGDTGQKRRLVLSVGGQDTLLWGWW